MQLCRLGFTLTSGIGLPREAVFDSAMQHRRHRLTGRLKAYNLRVNQERAPQKEQE